MHELLPVLERFLEAQRRALTVAPARTSVPFDDDGRIVFTVGGFRSDKESFAGFRAYHTFSGQRDDQLVAVWDRRSGALRGVVIGSEIGIWRTGALGGIATKYLAAADADRCAVIGTGPQAGAQLRAVASVRALRSVKVWGRTYESSLRFAEEMSAQTGVRVDVVRTAEEATSESSIVICATRSETPVVSSTAIEPGAFVISVGPKLASAHELPLEIAERLQVIVSDSPEQLDAYHDEWFLRGTSAHIEVERLCDVMDRARRVPIDRSALRLYISTGLAGTEVALAAHLLKSPPGALGSP